MPNARDIRNETEPHRKKVMQAIKDVFDGKAPRQVENTMQLAKFAGVPRSRLVQGNCTDLNNLFIDLVAQSKNPTTPLEKELAQQIARLQNTVADQKAEIEEKAVAIEELHTTNGLLAVLVTGLDKESQRAEQVEKKKQQRKASQRGDGPSQVDMDDLLDAIAMVQQNKGEGQHLDRSQENKKVSRGHIGRGQFNVPIPGEDEEAR